MTAVRCLLCLVMLSYGALASAEWFSRDADIMGTRISVELWHEDAEQAGKAMQSVLDEMRRVDRLMSPYIDSSEVTGLNRRAADTPVTVSKELFALLQRAQHYAAISDGAFDISFASVGRFYQYRDKQQPSQQQIDTLLPAIDYRSIVLDDTRRAVQFLHPDLKIDLGGIAKGYAVDQAITRLHEQGIQHAIVSAGGDSRLLGDRRGRPWVIGIKHPRKPEQHAVMLPLESTAISTSGDYERFFIEQGERIHHIISPATGRSAGQVQSVSILAPFAIDSDALSTTVFVLGVKKGLALVNGINGVDAIVIDGEGKLHYSEGLLMPVGKAAH